MAKKIDQRKRGTYRRWWWDCLSSSCSVVHVSGLLVAVSEQDKGRQPRQLGQSCPGGGGACVRMRPPNTLPCGSTITGFAA